MIWPFVIAFVVSFAVTFVMRPRVEGQKAPGINEVHVPTAEVGREIPVLFGTKFVNGPNVVWYGGVRIVDIKKKKQTVGYRYYASIHFVPCYEADAILEVRFDKKTAWQSSNPTGESFGRDGKTITVSAIELFGGDAREGGVGGYTLGPATGQYVPNPHGEGQLWQWNPRTSSNNGQMHVLGGYSDQQLHPFFNGFGPGKVPNYRGVVSVIFEDFYFGNSHYIKPPSFKFARTSSLLDKLRNTGLNQDSRIAHDMNPATIILECLLNEEWGMGYPLSAIDQDAFRKAHDTLGREQMGMSLMWDKSVSIEQFLKTVLDHIDGNLYISRSTGQFVLTLVREDEQAIRDAITLDEDHISKVTNFKRALESELISEVTIKYWDSYTDKEAVTTVSDNALARRQGLPISTTRTYHGFTNAGIAQRVALRTLKAMSQPIASCTIEADRTASKLNIGDVFWLSWEPYGLRKVLFRVAAIDYGNVEHVAVRITAVQDVFALPKAQYAEPTTEWEDFYSIDPLPIEDKLVVQPPYYEVQEQGLDMNAAHVMAAAPRNASHSIDFLPMVSEHDTSTYLPAFTETSFCPSADVTGVVTRAQTVLPYHTENNLVAVRPGSYAYLGQEIVLVSTIDYDRKRITVKRGGLDTLPVAHADGARLLFVDDYFGPPVYTTLQQNLNVYVKLLARNSKGTVPLNETVHTQVKLGTVARHRLPYNAARVRLNGQAELAQTPGTQPLHITWEHRNKLTSAYSSSEDNHTTGLEPGVQYVVGIHTSQGKQEYVTTSDSYTVQPSVWAGETAIAVTLETRYGTNDATRSWQRYKFDLAVA